MEIEFEKMPRNSAVQHVVDAIGIEIQNGNLREGDKLPGEAELAEKLGVGRSSIREGINRLAAYGLVEVRQGHGTFIADNLIENLSKIVCYLPILENLDAMLSVRRILECGCMKIVCGNISPADCDELERLSLLLSMEYDIKTRLDADKNFHNIIISASHNILLIRIYETISSLIGYLMGSLIDYQEIVDKARESHLKITKGLRMNNVEFTLDAIDEHLATVEFYAKKYL